MSAEMRRACARFPELEWFMMRSGYVIFSARLAMVRASCAPSLVILTSRKVTGGTRPRDECMLSGIIIVTFLFACTNGHWDLVVAVHDVIHTIICRGCLSFFSSLFMSWTSLSAFIIDTLHSILSFHAFHSDPALSLFLSSQTDRQTATFVLVFLYIHTVPISLVNAMYIRLSACAYAYDSRSPPPQFLIL